MLIFRRCMLVAMLTEDAPAEKAEGIVLACRILPQSNLRVEPLPLNTRATMA
jgi:hypothetical protein